MNTLKELHETPCLWHAFFPTCNVCWCICHLLGCGDVLIVTCASFPVLDFFGYFGTYTRLTIMYAHIIIKTIFLLLICVFFMKFYDVPWQWPRSTAIFSEHCWDTKEITKVSTSVDTDGRAMKSHQYCLVKYGTMLHLLQYCWFLTYILY